MSKVLPLKTIPNVLKYCLHHSVNIMLCCLATPSQLTRKQAKINLVKPGWIPFHTDLVCKKAKSREAHTSNWQRCKLMPWFLESLWGMVGPVPGSSAALLRSAIPTGVRSTDEVISGGLHRRCGAAATDPHTHTQSRPSKQLLQHSRSRQTTLCSWTQTSLMVWVCVQAFQIYSCECVSIGFCVSVWLCVYECVYMGSISFRGD